MSLIDNLNYIKEHGLAEFLENQSKNGDALIVVE